MNKNKFSKDLLENLEFDMEEVVFLTTLLIHTKEEYQRILEME